jgi:hypothetical protein
LIRNSDSTTHKKELRRRKIQIYLIEFVEYENTLILTIVIRKHALNHILRGSYSINLIIKNIVIRI